MRVVTVPEFSPVSQQLRNVFDERFQDPRRTTPERFLWDYWYVKDQYTLHRTQAAAYFPEQLHEQLVDALLDYGEKQLGCRAISPVWMSYYIDGCGQDLHCDSFHGPFAYVLSLTPWEGRVFTGGCTTHLGLPALVQAIRSDYCCEPIETCVEGLACWAAAAGHACVRLWRCLYAAAALSRITACQ
eukprot:GHRQ01025863.1.p2 GENE.GHRQ01025863.1~~GHRQ01025863.1.p2  ORF type:complete len:186 (+),score=52.74 GHRQ01025863.1:828-1385(+)